MTRISERDDVGVSLSSSSSSSAPSTAVHDPEAQSSPAAAAAKAMSSYSFFRLIVDQPAVTQAVLHHEYPGRGTPEAPYLVDFLPDDPRNAQKWTKLGKWTVTVIQAVATLAVSFSSSAYSGGVADVMAEFDVGITVGILGVSMFVLGFAIGPLIWAPFSEMYGRQLLFFITYMALTAFNAAAAGAPTIEALLVLRFMAGAFGSSPLTNAGGVIADMFNASDRGIAMPLFAMAPFLGPALGPIAGGFLGQAAGWRWIEGLMAIFTGIVWIVGASTCPETYAPVLLRRRAAKLSKLTGKTYISKLDEGKPPVRLTTQFKIALSRPWIMLLKEPIVFFISIYMAIIYGTLFMCFAAFPIVFQQGRGWSPGIGGLAFTGIAVGMFLAVLGALWDNKRYTRIASKSGGVAAPEVRLPPAIVGSILLPIGEFWFAWTNGPEIHWVVSIIGAGFFSSGITLVFLSLSNYLIDSYVIYAASVLAASAVLRSLFAVAFPLFTSYMYADLGIHWASSVPAFLALACMPFPFLFWKYGEKIRMKCQFAAEAAEVLAKMLAVQALSSPSSFYTANDTAGQLSTNASSPVYTSSCPYRDARQLPHELKEHCQIFLEEQLFSCAINLLNSIVGSGSSRHSPPNKPVAIPPPSHLALLNTLAIHPLYTTRAETLDHLETSSLALAYLRNLLNVVGPVNADFRAAFQFHNVERWARRAGYGSRRDRRRDQDQDNDSDMSELDETDGDRLRGRMANDSSVWSRGQDVWSTVGWAFNCSALQPQRWRYWKAWLEFMMDVIEADWVERTRRDREAYDANGGHGDEPVAARQQSIMAMYMDQQNGRHGGMKSMLKAILASGDSLSVSAFPEVFEKEHRAPRKEPKKRKRQNTLDVENDQFGDYLDDEFFSSGVSEPATPQKRRAPREAASCSTSEGGGLAESMSLRLRLFKMLSEVIHALGKPSELEALYEGFATAVKLLPLPLFSLIVTQRPTPLLMATHVTLARELFRLLLPSSYKDPRKVDREADMEGALTMLMLEQSYLPNAANTIALDDNAKLSLVSESAIQLLWIESDAQSSDEFVQAVEKGILARETKVKRKRTGKARVEAADAHAQEVLNNSTKRIRIMVEAMMPMELSDE
ncbi:major facilitator superfamily transporter [Stachybotrys elegans]|uniref:Major facilitator superfamily transporter n=1 Tax=Stachybotrys elegans TaxID=80388 RepID=A0A8K0T3E1_9HYPO|nr:major facilitator superfamily transporter [Stachybotrys elegans]